MAIGANGGADSQEGQITFRVKNLPAGRAREVIEDGNVSNNFDEVNPTEIVVKTSADRHHAFTIR